MSHIEKLSDRVRQLCVDKNISPAALAQKSNISKSTINNLLNLKVKTIRINNLYKICCAFDITLSQFFSTPEFNNLEREKK